MSPCCHSSQSLAELSLHHFLERSKKPSRAHKAEICRNLLRDLGIDYRWVSYEPKQEATWKNAWRKEIAIEEDKLIHRSPPARSGRTAVTWLSVEPHFQKIEDAAELRGVSGAQAFRYMLVMAAIRFA